MVSNFRRVILPAVLTGLWLILTLYILQLGSAQAEPYIAVRTGLKCATCHVNQTGGGKRTDYGAIYAQTKLPMTVLRPPEGSTSFDGHLSPSVSLGGNLRVTEQFVFEHTSSTGETFPSSNVTDFTEANVYVEVDVVSDLVTFYVDQTVAPSSSNRELFGLVKDARRHAYAKAGRMLLPYGLRLWDDAAFIRSRTGYNYSRSGTGLEVGWEPHHGMLVGNVTDDNFSAMASVVFRRVQFGGSFGRHTHHGNESSIGPFGGVNVGRFTLLGELAFIEDGDRDQLASLAELNCLVTRGLNVKFTYEFFDRNTDVDSARDGQERFTLGLEPFLAQFVQLRAYYRFNNFIPQNGPQNQDQALLEFHVFF